MGEALARCGSALAAWLLAAGSISWAAGFAVAQDRPPAEAASIRLLGEPEAPPLGLSSADLAAMPRTTLDTTDHRGVKACFEGVDLAELLARSGAAPMGDDLRGEALATYVLVEAADGYRVVFSLAELDPALGGRVVLLADRRDGHPLAATEGPLRLVVPADKRSARWVRMVRTISLHRPPPTRTQTPAQAP